jgi:hypothetical protein
MRKMMLTLTTVGLLAVPAGMALAQSDDDGPAEPVPTSVDPEQDRDRDRDRTGDQVPGAPDQQQTQLRTQEQLHDGDCTGDHAQNQHRVQDQAHLADGDGEMHRRGATGTAGTG